MPHQCTMVADALLLHILIEKIMMIGLITSKGGDAQKYNCTKEYTKRRECKCTAVTNNY